MKAFPSKTQIKNRRGEYTGFSYEKGMDLRDYFAIHAKRKDIRSYIDEILEELNADYDKSIKDLCEYVDEYTNPEIICIARYRYADDMIQASLSNIKL